MTETKNQIREILNAIECDERAGNGETLSMEQVREILLGDRQREAAEAQRKAEIVENLDFLREKKEIPYYSPLPQGRSLKSRIATLIKRVIRRMIRPIILPIVEAQSAYNETIHRAMYEMYQREERLLMEQKALRNFLIAARKELEEKDESSK